MLNTKYLSNNYNMASTNALPTRFTLSEKFDPINMKIAGFSDGINVPTRHGLLKTYGSCPDNAYPVKYYLPMDDGIGRFKAVTTVSCSPYVYQNRELRETLAASLYWDVDIKNCHPSFALQFCEKHGLPCDSIADYVLNRDSHLQAVCTAVGVAKEEAKNLFVREGYGGSIKKWCSDFKVDMSQLPEIVHGYKTEMRTLMKVVCKVHPEYVEHVEKIREAGNKVSDDVEASAVAKFFHTIERQCITAAMLEAQSQGYEVGSIIYDGMHVLKGDSTEPPAEEVLASWAEAAFKATGYSIGLAIKPMTPARAILEGRVLDVNEELDQIIARIAKHPESTVELRNLVLFFVKNSCVSAGGERQRFYWFDGVRWLKDEGAARLNVDIAENICALVERFVQDKRLQSEEVLAEIKRLASDRGVEDIHGRDRPTKMAMMKLREEHPALFKQYESFADMAKGLQCAYDTLSKVNKRKLVIEELEKKSATMNPRFLDKLDANRHLLAFEDGVYDFKEQRFRKANREDYITMSTGYNFARYDIPEIQKEIEDTLRDSMPNEANYDYLMRTLAHNLSGNKFTEKLWFLTGNGRNGKGLLMSLYMNTLGMNTGGTNKPRGYAYSPQSTFLTGKEAGPSAVSPDKAGLQGARILLLSEPTDAINIPLLKAISGRDPMTGRELYMPPVTFLPQCGVFISMNNVPPLPGADDAFLKRLEVVNFPYQFVVEEEKKFSFQKLLKPELKERFERVEYRQQFARMLIKCFEDGQLGEKIWRRPESVVTASVEVMQRNDPVRAFLAFAEETDLLERCEPIDGRVRVDSLKTAFDQYLEYTSAGVSVPWKMSTFMRKMVDNSFKVKTSNGISFYYGLTLNPDWAALLSAKFSSDYDA